MTQVAENVLEDLEVRLAALREEVVDLPTTEKAVEQAQVRVFTETKCHCTVSDHLEETLKEVGSF